MENWKETIGTFDFHDIYLQIVKETPDVAHFIEIGGFLGKSSIYLAKLIKLSKKEIKLDVIDLWIPQYYNKKIVSKESLYNLFQKNIIATNVDDIIQHIKIKSREAYSIYKDGSLDFIFIAGDTNYLSMQETISIWFPKLKKDGYIGGCNYDIEHPEIIRAVGEFFTEIEIRNTSWIYKK